MSTLDHIPSDLPADWRVTPLANACASINAGGTPTRTDPRYWGGTTPFALIEDVTDCGLYLTQTKEFISEAGLENSSAWLVPPGSVLVTMYATIGATAVTKIATATNQAIAALFPNDTISAEFLAFSIRHYRDALTARNVQATQKNINKGILQAFEIPLPPLGEQQRIAAVLGKVQKAIEAEGELIRVTRELKQAALRQLFTRGLRGEPQKQTDLGQIPESWDIVPLSYFGRVGNGSTPRRTEPSYWNGGTIPWLTSAKVYDRIVKCSAEFVTPKAVEECHLPKAPRDSLIIAITGQGKTLGHVARVAIETCMSQHLAYVTMERANVVPDFVRQYLDTRYAHLRQIAMGGGSTKGALTCGFLKSYPVPLPKEKDEQHEIAAHLSTIDANLAHHEARQELLRELFRTLLRDLMTARRRVKDIDLSSLSS